MKTKFLLTVASAIFLTFTGLAFAHDEGSTPSQTPNKKHCRSIPYKIRAQDKQLAQQSAKQVRTQAKLDEVLVKIAALPAPTPVPTVTASPTATSSEEHGKEHEHDNEDSHNNGGKTLSALEKLRDALIANLKKVADRIALINANKVSLNEKLALCPTPTPLPTATPVV